MAQPAPPVIKTSYLIHAHFLYVISLKRPRD